MRRRTLDRKSKLLPLLVAGIITGLSLPAPNAKGDIITDIEELEKEQDLTKKPVKKPVQTNEEDPKPNAAGSGKPRAPKAPVPEERDPETRTIIPEPIEEPVGQANPRPIELKSAKGKTKAQRKKAPIHLQSEGTTTYSQDKLTVILQKDVMITQDDLRLQSDEAKVTFLPKDSSESGVRTAVLEGKVAITRYSSDPTERMNAKSDKATFDNVQQMVTLDGNARLWRAGDLVRGERIIYDLTTGMIKIDKAQGVVQPDRMKK